MEKPILDERDINLKLIEHLSKKIRSVYLPDNILREYAQFLISLNENIFRDKKKLKIILLLIFSSLLTQLTEAQCISSPIVPSCNPFGSIALINNDIVTSGQIKTLNGSISFNSVTMSGGTLIVCGSLTLNAITFNSGDFIINPGASVVINPSMATVFGANSNIYNFGTFRISGSIVTGANNLIFNCSAGSIFTVAFNQFVIQGLNTYVINNGIISSSYFIVQPNNSSGVVCSGPASAIITNVLINQFANAFASPSGQSCINILQQVINSQPITSTSNVKVCYIAGNVNIITGPNFGAATVFTNCTNCSVILPLKLISFNGVCDTENTKLSWVSENEINCSHFVIESSFNALDFMPIAEVPAKNKQHSLNYYYYELKLKNPQGESIYLRLKQFNQDKSFSYSPIIYLACQPDDEFQFFPSFNNGNYFYVNCKSGLQSLTIYDSAGREVKRMQFKNESYNIITFDQTLSSGVYVVCAVNSLGKIFNKKMAVY